MGGSIGSIGKVASANVMRGLNISPIMQQAMGEIAQSGDQRAAFNAILLASAANVTKKPNFNLELEINDLNIRLGNLRNAAPSGGLFGAVGATAQLTMQLSTMLNNLDAAVQNIAKSVK